MKYVTLNFDSEVLKIFEREVLKRSWLILDCYKERSQGTFSGCYWENRFVLTLNQNSEINFYIGCGIIKSEINLINIIVLKSGVKFESASTLLPKDHPYFKIFVEKLISILKAEMPDVKILPVDYSS